MDNNELIKAQGVLLDSLSSKFGGSASAQAKTFQGQMQQLGNQFQDFKEIVGNSLTPAISYLVSAFSGMGSLMEVLLVPIRGLATGFIMLTVTAKELGIILVTIFSSIAEALTGNFSGAVDTIKQGFSNIVKEGQNAAQSLTQVWGSENAKQGASFGNLMNSEVNDQTDAAKKKAKDLADETEKFNDEMAKRKDTFEQSLADEIWAHQDKVKSIEKDMAGENANFKQSMQDQVDAFQQSMDDMLASHTKKVADINKNITNETTDNADKNAAILSDTQDSLDTEKKAHDKTLTDLQTQLDKEVARGKNASQTKIAILKQEISDENDAYDEKVTKINDAAAKEIGNNNKTLAKKLSDLQQELTDENTAYDADVAKKTAQDTKETLRLQQTHDKQVLDYQTSLDAEKKILSDHQTEVNAIKDKARVDDITKTEQQFATENADALKQHLKKMADIQGNSTAEGAADTAGFTNGINSGAGGLINAAKNISTQAKNALSTGGGGSWGDTGSNLMTNFLNGIWKALNGSWSWLSSLASSIGNLFSNSWNWAVSKLPHGAQGFTNFQGGMAVVGENGPELVRLPQGADVIPNNIAFGGGGQGGSSKGMNQSISIHIDKVSGMSDIDALNRELGFKASLLPN